MRAALLPLLVVLASACAGDVGPRASDDSAADATPADAGDSGATEADDGATDAHVAGDGATDGDAAEDAATGADAAPTDATSTDSSGGDATDTDGTAAATDAAEEDVDATPACTVGAACLPSVYVPPCFQGRCSDEGACVIVPKPNCCRTDADCPPDALATACEEPRCVTQQCRLVRFPGCCADDLTACGAGTCDPAVGRCEACPAAPCPDAAPLFDARFDDGAWPLTTTDFQAADGVTWQVDPRRAAAGGRAAYLGNPRCATYYGGRVDDACQPSSDGEQDSGRVQVQARTPWLALPADVPAVASLWLWADVEPSLGRGQAEPDVLRVWVEPGDGGPAWLVASSLDVGKSTGGAWRPLLVDLLPWQGTYVRLLLDFDTFDGQDNRREGVWIDELVVAPACRDGGCCALDGDCPSPSPCAVGRCVDAAQGTGGRCVAGPPDPGTTCVECEDDTPCDDADPCTADRCADGACRHDAFCCLERDVLVIDLADGLGPLTVQDDDPQDGVEWQAVDGAAWFGDPTTGTYASRAPPRPVGGGLWTPTLTLPGGDRPLGLDLDLSLSTEWDLDDAASFANPAGLDRLTVEVADAGFTTELWSSDELAGTTRGETVPVRLDLSPWRGRAVQIRVRFDSGDADRNDFAGPRLYRLAAGTRCE